MSMIPCPDCGEQISSKASHCIHCGCVFQVCPECEAVLTNNPKTCPECGFQLKKETPPVQKVENEKSLLQWYEQAKINSSFIFSPKFALFLHFIAFLMFAYALVGTYMWAHQHEIAETLFMAGGLEETLSSRKTLYIISAVLWVSATALSHFGPVTEQRNYLQFVTVSKLNLTDLIDKEFKAGFQNCALSTIEKRVDAIRLSISAAQQQKDVFIAEKNRQNAWISSIASLAFTVPCCIFFIENTKVYMATKLFDLPFGFKNFEYIWLPIAGVVLNVIISLFERSADCTAETWLKENLPEHMDAYKHYVVNFMDVYHDMTIQESVNKM